MYSNPNYASNNRCLTPNSSSRRMHGYRGRNFMNTPPSFKSPSWTPRPNFPQYNYPDFNYGNGPRNNYICNNLSSPQNASYYQTKRRYNSSSTSTPNRSSSGNNSFVSSSSGTTPFSSPNFDKFRSPPRKRGHWSRGRKSFDRSSLAKEPAEAYYKPSMLENPWKKLESSKKPPADKKES